MNIYIIDRIPPMWKLAVKIGGMLTVLFAATFAMRIFVTDTSWLEIAGFVTFTILSVAFAVEHLQRSPFSHIETRLNATQINAWLRFGERCGLNTTEAAVAVRAYRMPPEPMAALAEKIANIPTEQPAMKPITHIAPEVSNEPVRTVV